MSANPGHDGALALVEDEALVFSLEGEKDSLPRHGPVSISTVLAAIDLAQGPPDAIAIGGWHGALKGVGAGYFGLDPPEVRGTHLMGHPVSLVSSSHERSHLFGSVAMTPEAPLEECVVLVWEGQLGAFYHWRQHGRSIERVPVMWEPGQRYSALYALADPGFRGKVPPLDHAGRLMALAAFADGAPNDVERATVDALLREKRLLPLDKSAYADSPLHDVGVHTPPVHRAAAYLSDRLFEEFHRVAEDVVPAGLPLIISGGCGLNCNWNSRWAESPRFSTVFVPPCANDSGSAIGTAVDAQVALGGRCRLDWRVDAGLEFARDVEPGPGWDEECLDFRGLATRIAAGAVVAWVQGRAEIGPRALGHRSLLASPLVASSHARLNEIKQRESYRPIAPCCLAEDLDRWFASPRPDPYMLFFSRVLTDALPAITHVDGSARVQAVGPSGPRALRRLLQETAALTGYGVLCNTSLNFPGLGFINRASHLFQYAESQGIDDVVINDRVYSFSGSDRPK